MLAVALLFITASPSDAVSEWDSWIEELETRTHFAIMPFPQSAYDMADEIANDCGSEILAVQLSWFLNVYVEHDWDLLVDASIMIRDTLRVIDC